MEIFYIPDIIDNTEWVTITGAEAKHITKVLRHKAGDELFGTDGRGNEFRLRIEQARGTTIICRIVEKKTGRREPKHRLALAQALLKGDKLSQVVEGATEVGVNEIIPFVSKRVIGKMGETKRRRLEKVAISGMKSSLRTVLPKIGEVVDILRLLKRFAEFSQVLVAYEEEKETGLAQVLKRDIQSLLLIVGPEGGFTDDEIKQMKEAGAIPFTLGPRRLKAETAALVVSSLCLGLLGDLG